MDRWLAAVTVFLVVEELEDRRRATVWRVDLDAEFAALAAVAFLAALFFTAALDAGLAPGVC